MQTATYKFIRGRNKYTRRDGKAPIYLQIIYKRKQAFVNTKMLVLKNQFKNQRIVNSENDVAFNNFIQAIMEEGREAERKFIRRGELDYTASDIARATDSPAMDFKSFPGYFSSQLEKSRELRHSTRKQYKVTLGHLLKFNRIQGMHHLTFTNIQEFDRYLIGRGLNDSSRRGHHKRLKKMITQAINDRQFSGEHPYGRFKMPREAQTKIRYLTEQEIDRIINFKTDNPELKGLEWVRDMFIFQCLTGLAYSDLKNLTTDNLFTDQGVDWIRIERQKTGVLQKILIYPKVEEILEKYGLPLPIRTNQKYNAYLKTLADLCGITKEVTSHVARHSFATYLLNRGVPEEAVAVALGHSTTKETKKYARLLDTTLRDQLLKGSQ